MRQQTHHLPCEEGDADADDYAEEVMVEMTPLTGQVKAGTAKRKR